ncbi:MAG: FAD/NAD(P)-binding protein [Rhodospirillales bacterium]|jgi:NAD(P)H-flavin reductase|nr:FAD/NAD(P)-binding protein [Rhodospirillales bacterium]
MAVTATLPETMVPRPYLVDRVTADVSDTFTLVLKPQYGTEQFAFRPGQFNMLYLYGVGEVPISISGDPNDPQRLVHTVRALGTVTAAMQKLKRGSVVGVRGPFGSSWPIDQAEGADIVIIAGGVGLAPLRPAIYAILARRERYGRFVILYGARSPKDILFSRQLERWRSRLDTFVDVTVDRATGAWHGNVGVVTGLIGHGGFDADHTVAMICGPELMIRYGVLTLIDRGVRTNNIYVSMERNMKCAVGFCGHCQWGGNFVCRDGPVFSFDQIADIFQVREL